MRSNPWPISRYEKLSSCFAALGIAVSGAALVGWFSGSVILKGIRPGYIPMAPNTALVFLVFGTVLIVSTRRSTRCLYGIRIIVILATTMVAARLSEYLTRRDLSVDRWLFRFPAEQLGLAPVGKMAFFTASTFLLLGTGLFLFTFSKRWTNNAAQALAVLVMFVGLAFSLGYLYGKPLTYDWYSIPMALNTAICFSLNGAALLIRASLPDIKERRTVRTALQKAHDELERANKDLEAFSYSVSHDLRAPLRAIDGFSRILAEDHSNQLDPDAMRVLSVIRTNTRNMSKLIDDLLAFSRLGRKQLERSPVDIDALAHAIADELRATPPERALRFEIEPLGTAAGDHSMLRQVFVNLLSNAVKYSKDKAAATIKVGSYVQNGESVYYVRDNGAGFDMNYADKLFGVFQRLHTAEEFEGTGVGLAIVQRIIQRHGGRVWAEGKVNEGATFYFSLPGKETNRNPDIKKQVLRGTGPSITRIGRQGHLKESHL